MFILLVEREWEGIDHRTELDPRGHFKLPISDLSEIKTHLKGVHQVGYALHRQSGGGA